jgi:hypothetical protein
VELGYMLGGGSRRLDDFDRAVRESPEEVPVLTRSRVPGHVGVAKPRLTITEAVDESYVLIRQIRWPPGGAFDVRGGNNPRVRIAGALGDVALCEEHNPDLLVAWLPRLTPSLHGVQVAAGLERKTPLASEFRGEMMLHVSSAPNALVDRRPQA